MRWIKILIRKFYHFRRFSKPWGRLCLTTFTMVILFMTPAQSQSNYAPFLKNLFSTQEGLDSLFSLTPPYRPFQDGAYFDTLNTQAGWIGYGINETRRVNTDLEFEVCTDNLLKSDNFGKYKPLAEDSVTISLMAVGTIVVLYMSPHNVSNWDEKGVAPDEMAKRYNHKVSQGPVIDKDSPGINYYGHPYFGGAYYVHSRHLGYNKNESFVFSFLMSTCMYEYGVEAFFERPSMQDLFVTPMIGTLHGEMMLFWERRIKNHQNTFAGSWLLGQVCLNVIDPIGCVTRQLDRLSYIFPNTHMKSRFFAYQTQSPFDLDPPGDVNGAGDFRFGFEVSWFNQ